MADRDDLPDQTRRLRQPSWGELRLLLCQVSERTRQTPLERVAQEVGETMNAVMMRELVETTVVMSRREAIGLSPDLYLYLLRLAYRELQDVERRKPSPLVPLSGPPVPC